MPMNGAPKAFAIVALHCFLASSVSEFFSHTAEMAWLATMLFKSSFCEPPIPFNLPCHFARSTSITVGSVDFFAALTIMLAF
jgi:hypothetical protein